jgi:DNA mismatch repair protein MutH
VKEPVRAPTSEAELLERALGLAGRQLGSLADDLGIASPPNLLHAKGWAGQLLERTLGATAASRAQPDFEAIGVELKTLPVDARGRPCESTFVCTIPLRVIGDEQFVHSRVWSKLRRVLWVPIQGDREIAPARRCIGHPLLWSPSAEESADLRCDWEEIAGRIGGGDVELLTGHVGRYLQVRPKARNASARRGGVDRDGAYVETLPRGFYLRARFTARILERSFVLPVRPGR